MRIVAVLLGALLAVAPTVAACACPAAPRAERMACAGTSPCCCGDAAKESTPPPCPRSIPLLDSLGQPADGLPAAAAPEFVVVALPDLDLPAPVTSGTPAAEDGRTRASPARPLFLLCSVLLL